jgi:esterase/lipase superfamily enzyme
MRKQDSYSFAQIFLAIVAVLFLHDVQAGEILCGSPPDNDPVNGLMPGLIAVEIMSRATLLSDPLDRNLREQISDLPPTQRKRVAYEVCVRLNAPGVTTDDQSLVIRALPRFLPAHELAPLGEGIVWKAGLNSNDAPYAVKSVFYGTDRLREFYDSSSPVFIAKRVDEISYGTVDVSIPRDHRLGVLEAASWYEWGFSNDPEKHVVVLKTTLLSKSVFFARMRATANALPTNSVLLFFHGFNVGFADAARRTAQIAYDLGFKGAAGFFSWPANNSVANYMTDEQSIVDAEPHIEEFLRDVLTRSGAANVYLLAHSMGTRGLTRALMSLATTNPNDVKRIKEVILAAPDIGTTEFKEQIAPGLRKLGAPVTLYASSKDLALDASMRAHGGPRAGESGEHIVVVDGVETIDATNTDTDLIGHSYYGDRRSVLADMWYLINGDMPASKRCCLIPQPSAIAPKWWVFQR